MIDFRDRIMIFFGFSYYTVWSFVRTGQANQKSDVLHEGGREDSSVGGSGMWGRRSRAWETLRIETLRRPRLGHVGLEWSKPAIFHAIPPKPLSRGVIPFKI